MTIKCLKKLSVNGVWLRPGAEFDLDESDDHARELFTPDMIDYLIEQEAIEIVKTDEPDEQDDQPEESEQTDEKAE